MLAKIVTPRAAAKIASTSAKSARELTLVLKNLQTAKEIILLETAVGVGYVQKGLKLTILMKQFVIFLTMRIRF